MNHRHSLAVVPNLAGIVAAAGFLLALNGAPAQAQQSELDDLRQTIVKLQSRLDKLEDEQKKAAAAPKPTVSTKQVPIVFSGLLQEQFNAFLSQDNPTGTAKQNDGFNLRRGELRITAPKVVDKVAATVMFDLAKTGSANGTTGRAGSVLQELQLTYDINVDPKSPMSIDVGQFKPGIGYESDLVSSSALLFTERALMYRFTDLASGVSAATNILNRGGLGDRRDQGARLKGALNGGEWNYNVGVFNGLGDTQNNQAQGDPKAFAGRIYYKPGTSGLTLGGSYAIADTRNVIPIIAPNVVSRINRTFYGAFANYKKDKITLQGEYANLKSNDKDGNAKRDGNGYYAYAGYMLAPKWELVGKYDRLKQETTSAAGVNLNGVAKEIALGFNYYIKGNNAKIQMNVVKVDGDGMGSGSTVSGTPIGTAFDSYQLRTQYQVSF